MSDSVLTFLEAATALLAVLAWPTVVLILFFCLRVPVRGMLERLSRLKHGEIEAEFAIGLDRATSLAPQVTNVIKPEEVTPHIDDADRVESLFRLAKVSARGAVMDAWREVELAAVGAALGKNRSPRGPLGRVSGIAAVEHMNAANDVTDAVLGLYRELRSLRNRANEDDFALAEADARRYVLLSLQLASFFRRMERADAP